MRLQHEGHDAVLAPDENHSVEENELLRSKRLQVLGGGRYADRMEHDRDASFGFDDGVP